MGRYGGDIAEAVLAVDDLVRGRLGGRDGDGVGVGVRDGVGFRVRDGFRVRVRVRVRSARR